jgi:hypothetical protein
MMDEPNAIVGSTPPPARSVNQDAPRGDSTLSEDDIAAMTITTPPEDDIASMTIMTPPEDDIAAMTTMTPSKDDIAAMTIIEFVANYSTSNPPMVEKDPLHYGFLSDEHYMTVVEGLKNQDTKVVLSNGKTLYFSSNRYRLCVTNDREEVLVQDARDNREEKLPKRILAVSSSSQVIVKLWHRHIAQSGALSLNCGNNKGCTFLSTFCKHINCSNVKSFLQKSGYFQILKDLTLEGRQREAKMSVNDRFGVGANGSATFSTAHALLLPDPLMNNAVVGRGRFDGASTPLPIGNGWLNPDAPGTTVTINHIVNHNNNCNFGNSNSTTIREVDSAGAGDESVLQARACNLM